MLAIEDSATAPVVMRGILPSWRRLESAGEDGPWHERVLPARFRPSFGGVPGLEGYAVGFADRLPERLRSPAWRRLVGFCARATEMPPSTRAALAQVLGQLCLFPELERCLSGTPAVPAGPLDEIEGLLAYWKAFLPFMLREPEWLGRTATLLRLAEAAQSGTRIRLIAGLKFLVLNLEHRQDHPELRQGLDLAERALKALCARVPSWEGFVWRSKYWRTVCYVPFLAGEHARLNRELQRALDLAERAVTAASGQGAFAASFAEENLHAVLATRGIAWMHLRRPKEAEPYFERMAALDPNGAWQRIALARTRLAGGHVERAAADFKNALALAALERESACDGLARCMARLGRPAEERRWRRAAESVRKLVDVAQPNGSS